MAGCARDGVEDGKEAGQNRSEDDDNDGLPPVQAYGQKRCTGLVCADVDIDEEPELKVLYPSYARDISLRDVLGEA